MPAERNRPKRDNFNAAAQLPFQLRLEDFEIAMQDVYDLFFDVNSGLLEKGLERWTTFFVPPSCPVCFLICSLQVSQNTPAP
jgi:hypothetical protein